jgi:tetratricopeptide (TPR) repeat protein
VFQTYDAERGEGARAAARLHVQGYPTLVLLDAQGHEITRQLGIPSGDVAGFLKSTARLAGKEADLEAELARHPRDLQLLWALARRAESRHDVPRALKLLSRIEQADDSQAHAEAGRAAWERQELALRDSNARRVTEAVLDQVKRYPGQATQALPLLGATGADRKITAAAFERVIAATAEAPRLNQLIYDALAVGQFDAALAAAQKQLLAQPNDPNAYDSLAEVYNYRHQKAEALATEQKGLAMPNLQPDLARAMRANLKRFETGGESGDVRPARELSSPLEPAPAPAARSTAPREVTERLYAHEAAAITRGCADKAGGLEEAWVRIVVGSGARVEKVELLEPGATAALRKCLEKGVRAVVLPADSPPVRVTMALPLPAPGGGAGPSSP